MQGGRLEQKQRQVTSPCPDKCWEFLSENPQNTRNAACPIAHSKNSQRKRLTETLLPFLHLLSHWSTRGTTIQPKASEFGEQLSASRLRSGFVKHRTIQHDDRKRRKGEREASANRTQSKELETRVSAAVHTHMACESAFIADRRCSPCAERCWPQMTGWQRDAFPPPPAMQRPSDPAGSLITAAPAARCYANRRFQRAKYQAGSETCFITIPHHLSWFGHSLISFTHRLLFMPEHPSRIF